MSLGDDYRSNKKYYSDVLHKISGFINSTLKNICNLDDTENNFTISDKLVQLSPKRLNKKVYRFKGEQTDLSQFQGIRKYGVYKGIDQPVRYVFVFENKFRDFANNLFFSLIGKSNPGTFSGMQQFFNLPFSQQTIEKVLLNSYSPTDVFNSVQEIENIQSQNPNDKIIVIFLEPDRFDGVTETESPYYILKFHLTQKGIPIQVVRNDQTNNANALKWSTSNIALQIFAKLSEPPEKKEEKEKCFCNRDFEEKDVRKFVKLLKGSETIWEGQALKGGKRAECHISDKSFATLTAALNNSFKKYNINHCSQKMHFLAQVCEETGTFSLSEETKSDFISSQSIYKGRGILQLTGVKIDPKDTKSRYDKPGPYKDYADYKDDQNIVKKPEVVANNVQYAIDSGSWIWSVNKKMTNNPKSEAITKWGKETLGKSLNELAIYEDKYLELISVLLNGRNKNTGMPNGWATRQMNYNLLKTGFFMYEKYHGKLKENNGEDKGLVSYHIYFGGKIEKHIPKEIREQDRKKYKYIYHDKNGEEHVLGTFNYTLTKEMNKGNIAGNNSVELIDIREFKGYSSNEVKLKFLTLNTSSKRYYINPDCYAGLLGAMADMNIDYLGFNGFSNFEAKSTGGSSSHRNGEKGDLRYLSKNKKGEATILQDTHFDVPNQNKFNDALYNFGWGRLEKMYSEYFNYAGNKSYLLNHTKHMRKDGPKGYRHYHHLHLSGFDHSLIKIMKK